MNEFVIATANRNKAEEIAQILGEHLTLRTRPPDVPEVPETGRTLIENARLKAVAIVRSTGLPAIADDTGLEVEALGGAPGVYSARYAGEGASYRQNVTKLIEALAEVPEPRVARFRTVALAAYPGGREVVAEGIATGSIASNPRGRKGFGYDSVFIPTDGDGRTYAEMDPEEKNLISHRGAAFRKLRELLQADPESLLP